MRAPTADPKTGAAGRGPGCNMESPIKGDQEERAYTAGRGRPATGAPPTGREDGPEGKGAPAGSGAKGDYPAAAKPRGAGRGVQDCLSQAPPLPLPPDSDVAAKGEGACWSPGRRDTVQGPELRRLLRERLEESNQAGVRSAWQGVELVWRVLRLLVPRMDLGRMGPLVA